MTQPAAYDRSVSFTNLQAADPTGATPGASLDAEFNAVKATLDEVLANLELIQRDDGELANESVGLDQLSEEIEVGWQAPEVWVTATAYIVGNTVFHGSGFYRCLVAHTAGTFATDLSALKWELIVDLSAITIVAASQIANTPAGSIAATTVQAAIDELASEKAASSHTHPSSAITDGTAVGRNMFTAANLAAQKTLLGLGALAFLNDIAVDEIIANLSLTGVIEPAALAVDTNDWSPTGVAGAAVIRMSASAPVSLSGLLAPLTDGTIVVLDNVGTTNNITLLASSTLSAAANRFLLPRPVIVRPNQSVTLKYDLDGTTPRWRLMTLVSTQPVAGGFKNLRVTNVATPFGDTAPATPNAQIKILADAITLDDSNGEAYRALSVSVTVDSSVSGANGLDTGAVANSTWYSQWVIFNPTTNTVAGLMSTSATAPTMPSGYTFKARVGWNRTNASAQFNRVMQLGRRARYVVSASVTTVLPTIATDVLASTWSASTPTWVTPSVATLVPSTATSIGIVWTNVLANAAQRAMQIAPNNLYLGHASSNPAPFSVNTTSVAAMSSQFWMDLEATTLAWAATGAGAAALCAGWEDNI